eukprot:GHVQ01025353.1.p1 GENE.GHVQ01025353.1~~GHVQ01025353.1.p1  ORF type:complete len:558 (+),score=98.21 GHVQ01025353.1:500-2173(+)
MLAGLQCLTFVTSVTPHLGLRSYSLDILSWTPLIALRHALTLAFCAQTGNELLLRDTSVHTVSSPTQCDVSCDNFNSDKGRLCRLDRRDNGCVEGECDGVRKECGSRPMLLRMTDNDFLRPLRAFKYRLLYANKSNDILVPFPTAAIDHHSKVLSQPKDPSPTSPPLPFSATLHQSFQSMNLTSCSHQSVSSHLRPVSLPSTRCATPRSPHRPHSLSPRSALLSLNTTFPETSKTSNVQTAEQASGGCGCSVDEGRLNERGSVRRVRGDSQSSYENCIGVEGEGQHISEGGGNGGEEEAMWRGRSRGEMGSDMCGMVGGRREVGWYQEVRDCEWTQRTVASTKSCGGRGTCGVCDREGARMCENDMIMRRNSKAFFRGRAVFVKVLESASTITQPTASQCNAKGICPAQHVSGTVESINTTTYSDEEGIISFDNTASSQHVSGLSSTRVVTESQDVTGSEGEAVGWEDAFDCVMGSEEEVMEYRLNDVGWTKVIVDFNVLLPIAHHIIFALKRSRIEKWVTEGGLPVMQHMADAILTAVRIERKITPPTEHQQDLRT